VREERVWEIGIYRVMYFYIYFLVMEIRMENEEIKKWRMAKWD